MPPCGRSRRSENLGFSCSADQSGPAARLEGPTPPRRRTPKGSPPHVTAFCDPPWQNCCCRTLPCTEGCTEWTDDTRRASASPSGAPDGGIAADSSSRPAQHGWPSARRSSARPTVERPAVERPAVERPPPSVQPSAVAPAPGAPANNAPRPRRYAGRPRLAADVAVTDPADRQAAGWCVDGAGHNSLDPDGTAATAAEKGSAGTADRRDGSNNGDRQAWRRPTATAWRASTAIVVYPVRVVNGLLGQTTTIGETIVIGGSVGTLIPCLRAERWSISDDRLEAGSDVRARGDRWSRSSGQRCGCRAGARPCEPSRPQEIE